MSRVSGSKYIMILSFLMGIPGIHYFAKYFLLLKLKGSGITISYGFSCLNANIIGSNITLQNTKFFDYGNVYIGSGSGFSFNNIVLTSTHDLTNYPLSFSKVIVADVNIGKNVRITTNCVILPGITIGDNSVIGAGSIVTRDIPKNCLAAGNPCKVIKYFK